MRRKATVTNLWNNHTFEISYDYIYGDTHWKMTDVRSKWGYIGRVKKQFRVMWRLPYLFKFKENGRTGLFLVQIDFINETRMDLELDEKTSLEMAEILDTWEYPNE